MRTFVRTGNRIDGRAEILSGVKAGDRVVAVGQLKLQSGAAVAISPDRAAADPGKSAALLIYRSIARWSGPTSSSSGRCWRWSSAC